MFEGEQSEQIKRDIRRLADDMSEMSRKVMGQDKEALRKMRDQAREQVINARDMVQERARNVDKYVHKKPWAAVGVAALFGVLVGVVVNSKKRR